MKITPAQKTFKEAQEVATEGGTEFERLMALGMEELADALHLQLMEMKRMVKQIADHTTKQ